MKFYVYRWYNTKTNYTFYIGKGCKDRYKSLSKRNVLFNKYVKENDVKSEILEFFDNEEDAFCKEKQLIKKYKENNECCCNIDSGGNGGVNFVWTPEMRKHKSEFNPMKNKNQKHRMSVNNPMKNKEIARIVGEKRKKKPVINNVVYKDVQECAKIFNVHVNTVRNWCKRGYSTENYPCKYENESYKNVLIPDRYNRQPVIIDGIEFSSMREGAKFLNCDPSLLTKAVKLNRLYKGHCCKYGNQQPSQMNFSNSNLEGSTTNERG